jgi:hypothetical protein
MIGGDPHAGGLHRHLHVYIPTKIVVFLRYGVIALAFATSAHLGLNFLLQLAVLELSVARIAGTDTIIPQPASDL